MNFYTNAEYHKLKNEFYREYAEEIILRLKELAKEKGISIILTDRVRRRGAEFYIDYSDVENKSISRYFKRSFVVNRPSLDAKDDPYEKEELELEESEESEETEESCGLGKINESEESCGLGKSEESDEDLWWKEILELTIIRNIYGDMGTILLDYSVKSGKIMDKE